MEKMFSRIEAEFPQYGVTVVSKSPWIVTFDTFLTEAETNALIETNQGRWERSTDTGSVNAFGEVLPTHRVSTLINNTDDAFFEYPADGPGA